MRRPVLFWANRKKTRFLILSGCDIIRFPTIINHKYYADRHDYRYRFDISPHADRRNVYFHKLSAIEDAIQDADWIFWLDDDAAFSQPDRRLEEVVPELLDDSVCAIFCSSPINPQGGWTFISSGNFFVRNSESGKELIRLAKETNLDEVKAWWDEKSLGMFTYGDQDAIVYQIKTNKKFEKSVKVLEYQRFNARPYHFTRANEYFIVHFTNLLGVTKSMQMKEFASTYGLNEFLVSEGVFSKYVSYAGAQRKMISTPH